jgi:uncharacterized integral membrane protein
MLRYLNYILYSFVAVLLILFSLANRDIATIFLFPEEFSFIKYNPIIQLPLFVVFFSGAIFGVMIGFVLEWIREYKLRAESHRKTRQIKGIQRQLQQLKDEKYENQDEVLALLEETTKEMKKSAPLKEMKKSPPLT